ncbi:MAG: hypothetical protein HZB14_08565 [Actinobacteria bacterium]|nr:hypothetical protein [Actinomycetota bacterium]
MDAATALRTTTATACPTTKDDEGAGTIVSFENGVLTIQTFAGETVSGTVDATTKIECGCDDNDDDDAQAPSPTATASHDDGPDDSNDDDDDDSRHSSSPGSDDGPDDDDSDHCGVEALVAGATVHEATLIDGLFVKIELAG